MAEWTDSDEDSKKNQKFLDFLKDMNIRDKFPQHLSLRNAMTVTEETLKVANTTNQRPLLPYVILQKIMMSDIRCRSCLYQNTTSQSECSSDSDSDDEDDGRIHPVDCLLAVIHCCDDILRQDVMTKLSLCQLAVPLLLPNPVDDSVKFLLWSLRSLFRGWKSLKHGSKECRIVDYEGPIVPFLRLGESQSSKSKILNKVIGGQEYFFNWDCEGGSCERNFVDGLVELCCYYPRGKDADFYTDAIIFLNLRGDAQLYPRQVEFLQKISFLSVVLIAEGNIDEVSIRMLHKFSAAPGGIVLLLDEGKGKKETKESRKKKLELLNQIIPDNKCSKIQLKNKNMATITTKIRQKMAEKFENVHSENVKPLSACSNFAYEANIEVDEDNEYSKAGKQLAEAVMEQVHSIHYSEVKQKMLPLQGTELWHKWAMHDKERHRQAKGKDTIVSEYNSEKDKEKMAVRKEQIKLSSTLTPLMDCFMKCLMEKDVSKRKYFFQWLKLLLDDHSKKILPKLHANYQKTRDKLMHLNKETNSNNSEIQKVTEELKRQNQELIHASFGLEHLFREMGQIYESRMYSSVGDIPEKLRDEAKHLPQVMAEIMAEGHALELMDGDASHVPVSWVLAVIEKLKVVCGKDARQPHGGKVFVLSVLGIQSSGKSTLLNTMFGLRFNVSAGRCTRGAYIQLLPLNSTLRKTIDCDYMLIVDTEGLRAPELQLHGLKHDNELATFVIGVANATIINIFGETPGDLDDILQTALHAFIRMRKIEMKPSCTFVHQNVTDALAADKGLVGRQKFQAKLDEMTQAAAKVENCEGQYRKFSDVIEFNDSTDVFYFPSLWKGDPPMAPVNLGYSESTFNLKNALIKLIKQKQMKTEQNCNGSLQTFKLRIENLWQAVLAENFVFSFKNTLEVSAYSELDAQFGKWSWTMQHEMLKWKHTTENKIASWDCESEDRGIEEIAKTCYEEAEEKIGKVHLQLVEEMAEFFKSSEHSETLSTWYQETELKLRKLETESKNEAELYYKEQLKNKLNCIEIEKMEKTKIMEVKAHIRTAVNKNEGRKLDDKEIEEIFETEWEKWMNEFNKEKRKVKYPSEKEIETSIGKILRETLQASDHLIIKKLTDMPLKQRSCSLKFEIDKKTHLSSTKWLGFKSIESDDVYLAAQLTEGYLNEISEYLSSIKRGPKPFSSSYVYEMLKDLFSRVNELSAPEKHSKFVFTPEYKVDLALVACAYACDVFKQTTKEVKDKNDPMMQLNRLKGTFLNSFKDMYNKVSAEKAAANTLCDLLRSSVEEAVKRDLEGKVVDKIKKEYDFLTNKRKFKIEILKRLISIKSFSRYKTYLTDIRECFREWIRYYLDDYKYKMPSLARETLLELLQTLKEDVKSLRRRDDIKSIESWLTALKTKVDGRVRLTQSELKAMVGECNVIEFTEDVITGVTKMEEKLQDTFSNAYWVLSTMSSRSKSPENTLLNDLIGCTEVCPFCQEQCEMTNCNHSQKHSIKLHRYQCLGRYVDRNTNKLFFSHCSELVRSSLSFRNSDTSWNPHPYSDYTSVNSRYRRWNIEYCSNDPVYWQWFIWTFYWDIVKWVGASDDSYEIIPGDWSGVSESAARANLDDIL